jgi:hypothetical protein
MPARYVLALCVFALAACSDGNGDDGKIIRLSGDGFEVVLDVLKGTYDAVLDDGTVILERAYGWESPAIPIIRSSAPPTSTCAAHPGIPSPTSWARPTEPSWNAPIWRAPRT